jgi:hypothetical protein
MPRELTMSYLQGVDMVISLLEIRLLDLAFFIIFLVKLVRFLREEIGDDVGSLLAKIGQWRHRR